MLFSIYNIPSFVLLLLLFGLILLIITIASGAEKDKRMFLITCFLPFLYNIDYFS